MKKQTRTRRGRERKKILPQIKQRKKKKPRRNQPIHPVPKNPKNLESTQRKEKRMWSPPKKDNHDQTSNQRKKKDQCFRLNYKR
jgi:hypothetical protein